MSNDFEATRNATQSVYERHARHWDEIRARHLYERSWLDRFFQNLPPNPMLLDLACGAGDPIAKYFIEKGCSIIGVDYSKSMIEIAKERFPSQDWQVQDIRSLKVRETFHGIYSWDGFFHLSVSEQRELLPKLAQKIHTGGAILLTVGTGEGEVLGTVGGEAVYHASLSPSEYKHTLIKCGFKTVTYVAEDPDCLGRSVILAADKIG